MTTPAIPPDSEHFATEGGRAFFIIFENLIWFALDEVDTPRHRRLIAATARCYWLDRARAVGSCNRDWGTFIQNEKDWAEWEKGVQREGA